MKKLTLWLLVSALMSLPSLQALAEDYYVSANRGKGKKGTLEKPSKDLGHLIKKLKPGDVIHIAEGSYLGRGKNGSDVITVPVTIIGGYNDDFTRRDPWGAHKTILSGLNKNKNWVGTPRLLIDLSKYKQKEMPAILIDGIIIDHAGRNRYATEAQREIIRLANPKTGENPTPGKGGLVISASKTGNLEAAWEITVQNCVVTNTAPAQGALAVSGYKDSKIKIRNNIVINNTGTGIFAGTMFRPRDGQGQPEFLIENNTILFTWKHDPGAQSYSGNAFKVDPDTISVVRNNVLGFADKFGVHNAAKASIELVDNLIVAHVEADYLEFDTRIQLDDIEDEAEHLGDDSEGNIAETITVPVSMEWARLYGSRVLVDRNAMEADIKVQQTRANELRSMLGLPLQAGTVAAIETPVWLHRLSIDDAIAAGSAQYLGQYGSSLPQIQ